MENWIFYFLSAMLLISALLVVTINNLVRSIFLFFVSLFSLAGLYVFAKADFIALTQIVIYAGGVLVLMLFAFMLSNRELLGSTIIKTGFKVNHLAGIMIAVSMLFVLISSINFIYLTPPIWIAESVPVSNTDNTVRLIGIQTMTRYLLPFEIVSVFLMMALVGAAHLSRREKST